METENDGDTSNEWNSNSVDTSGDGNDNCHHNSDNNYTYSGGSQNFDVKIDEGNNDNNSDKTISMHDANWRLYHIVWKYMYMYTSYV